MSGVEGLNEVNRSRRVERRISCAGTTDETRRHKTGTRTKRQDKARHPVLCFVTPLSSLLLPPIDDDAARSRRRDTDWTLRLAAQPFESTLVVLKKVFERMETP